MALNDLPPSLRGKANSDLPPSLRGKAENDLPPSLRKRPELQFPMSEEQTRLSDPMELKTSLTPGLSDQQQKPPEGTDTPPSFGDIAKEAGGNLLKAREIAAIPAEKSKEGLQMLADFIPAPEPKPSKIVHTPSNPSFEVGKSDGTVSDLPQVDPGVSPLLSLPKLGAEVLAEFAPTFIHPDVVVAGQVLKGSGRLAQTPKGQQLLGKVGKLTDEHLPTFKRWFTYKFGQPQAAIDIAEEASAQTGMALEATEDLAKRFSVFNAAEQRAIADILKGTKKVKASPAMRKLAEDVRTNFKSYGKQLVELGALDEAIYLKNIDTYLPRFYRLKELQAAQRASKAGRKVSPESAGSAAQRLMKKQDIPEEVRQAYGEILEAGYPSVKGLRQLARMTNRFRMFEKMSVNPEIASAKPVEGWVKMRPGKDLGKLANKYVHPEVAADINSVVQRPITPLQKTFDKWKKFLSAWKFGKVVASPATHSRNMFTNAFWLDVSGVGPIKQAKLLPRAIGHIKAKDAIYREAQRQGLIGTELVGTDISLMETNMDIGKKGIQGMFERAINYGKKAANKAGEIYQMEEQVFKLAKFEDNLAKGMAPKEAAREAEQWIFNYSKVPPAVEVARQTIIPFATYFSKALPQLAKAIVKNPFGVYKYVAFFDSLEEVARKQTGLTKEQMKTVKDQTHGKGIIPRLEPKEGEARSLDVNFLTPWGETIAETGFGEEAVPIPQPFRPSGPHFALMNALNNYDPFMKRPLYKESDPYEVKLRSTTDYLGKALLPNLMPGGRGLDSMFRGGYHFHEVMDAIQGKPTYPKRDVKTVPEALLGSGLGLKTKVEDVDRLEQQAMQSKDYSAQDIDKSIASIMKRVALEEGVTEEEAEEFQKMMLDHLYNKVLKEPEAGFSLRPQIKPLYDKDQKIENKELR